MFTAMRLGAVDIGSNTVHALVADVVRGRLEDVAHYLEMPELGVQVARTGVIGMGRSSNHDRSRIERIPRATLRSRRQESRRWPLAARDVS